MKRGIIYVLLVFVFSAIKLNAQEAKEQVSIGELEPYISAYMKPFADAMSISMGGGWTHTAEVNNTLGFYITFNLSAVKIPQSSGTFDTSDLDMPGYSFPESTAPTISGSGTGPDVSRDFDIEGAPDFYFAAPDGLGLNYGGMVAIQAGIGLPKGTEVIGRFIPNISKTINGIMDGDELSFKKIGMWGIGVKHDIKQWIPVVKEIPILQVSGLFTYSRLYTDFSGSNFQITPAHFGALDNTEGGAETWSNQRFKTDISSLTGSFLVGANIPFFQPFIGFGFASSQFEGGYKGYYPVVDLVVSSDKLEYAVNEFEEDPLDVVSSVDNFNFQAGARLKLSVFALHYQYIFQKYSMHTLGLAVGIN